MLRPREHTYKALEHGLEAQLGVERCKIGQVGLRPDDPDKVRDEISEQPAIGPDCLQNGIAPARDLGWLSVQDLPDQRFKGLGDGRVGNVLATLIEFSGAEDTSREHDYLVQLVDYRRLANPRVAGHKDEVGFAAASNPVKDLQQFRCLI